MKNLSEADNLVSRFSEDEMRHIVIRDIPYRSSEHFSAETSEGGFFKLLEDNRVVKIYYNAPTSVS
jgi:hypothetical protein